MNPLGWAVVPLSIGLVEHAQTLPDHERIPLVQSVAAVKWGAAASNFLMLAGAGPAGLVVGLAVAGVLWQQGSGEREYAAWCAQWIAEKPGNHCLPFVASSPARGAGMTAEAPKGP